MSDPNRESLVTDTTDIVLPVAYLKVIQTIMEIPIPMKLKMFVMILEIF